jgi:hypothetical protein
MAKHTSEENYERVRLQRAEDRQKEEAAKLAAEEAAKKKAKGWFW